jgi:hypothetical protein
MRLAASLHMSESLLVSFVCPLFYKEKSATGTRYTSIINLIKRSYIA